MRTSRGVLLLLVVAIVILSSEMSGTAGVAAAAAVTVVEPLHNPPECSTFVGSGTCNDQRCRDDCDSELKGEGRCVAAGCQCWHWCSQTAANAPAN